MFNPCVVIPVYNHAQFVYSVFERVQNSGLFCVIVNDGSNKEDTENLRVLFTGKDNAVLIEQFPNAGKGAAVRKGMEVAKTKGYTHVVQVDADGQHNIEDLPRLLAESQAQPQALVTGVPIFDDSVPRSRLISRYITHFWVWVETLSFVIKDSMCGFRVYPLNETLVVIKHCGTRMEFDTQVMVKMFWRGVPIVSIPVKVVYPENGVSNFRLWRDNIRISWMHTRLVFGMLLRFPVLLFRKFKRNKRQRALP